MINEFISQDEFICFLKKIDDFQDFTFYQQKIFFSILASQFKYFLQNLYLEPNLLYKNGKYKQKIDLINIILLTMIYILKKKF